MIRGVIEACADCDTCRFLMNESCLLFPELYNLYDKEKEHCQVVNEDELQRLSEMCTLCGLCPCPNIRMDVIRSKTERVRIKGSQMSVRLLANVQVLGKLSSIAPKIINYALSFYPLSRVAKKFAGIHPQRSLPQLPDESFFAWAHRRGLDQKPDQRPKVAYFVGCTAGYFFPEVARAAVAVMAYNGVRVFIPHQQCCGMPTLLEGDEETTIQRVRSNLKTLLEALQDNFDIICTCPTCSFFMKVLLKEKAFYSEAYQRLVRAGVDDIMVPRTSSTDSDFVCLKKSMYAKILKDDGYFSVFDPLQRITLSENIMDLGEYLSLLQKKKGLNLCFGAVRSRMVYYTPCHQREQRKGNPYLDLLTKIPGLRVEPIGSAMDCCGMGGSLGYKKNFHDASVRLASPLIRKIMAAEPEAVITDCLSCRLQFEHKLPYPVYHPVEILSRAYEANTQVK